MIRINHWVAAACAPWLAGVAVADQIGWDNYGGTYLPNMSLTSERNTQLVESTWAVDDVVVDGAGAEISRLEWIGARSPRATYSKADVIILDENLSVLSTISDIPLGSGAISNILPDPNPEPDIQIYQGEIIFDDALEVNVDHFFIGVRLVGDGTFEGRNYMVVHSTGAGDMQGESGGYVQAATVGASNWRPAADIWNGAVNHADRLEFAFAVDFAVIPEPTALGLLAFAGLAALRRR